MTADIHTKIAYATKEDIFIRNKNLSTEIMPNADFVDMICLCAWGEYPAPDMKRMLNVLLVMMVEHGLTPSTISTRLTLLGAPESMQGAVAAGLLGVGDRYVGAIRNVADMLQQELSALPAHAGADEYAHCAAALIERYASKKAKVPGIGHPIHSDGDPRVEALRGIASDVGYHGAAWQLLEAISAASQARFKRSLPINAAGAIGASLSDMGLSADVGRGLALIARTAGLVAHILEERASPLGPDLWKLVLEAEKQK